MSINLNTNRYRGIPEPLVDADSLYNTVAALKEVVETITRQRGKVTDSAVTVEDLIELKLIKRSDIARNY